MTRALLIVSVLCACSSPRERAPTVGGGCATPPCTIGGANDGGTTDAAGDGASDADAGTSVSGSVVRFDSVLAANGPGLPNVVVRAPRLGGGTVDATSLATGAFALDGVAGSVGSPTWLQVLEAGVVRGFVGTGVPTSTLLVPHFFENASITAATQAGIVVADPDRVATVVVHVVDDAGKRLAGVSAQLSSGDRAYDDGASLDGTAKATGSLGTIVFFNVATTGLFPLGLERAGKTYATISMPVAARAISYLRVVLAE